MNCDSGEENNQTEIEDIKIVEAMLSDFPLFARQRAEIEIVDPVIKNNKEVTYGEIKIILPSTVTSLENIKASITSKELNLSKFSISPSNNESLSFEGGKTHVFTISAATGNKEALLHYTVSITKEAPPVPETLKLTNFTFEASKNRGVILNDIIISRRAVENASYEKVYLLAPVGTDFTKLVPTITYEGTHLYYTQDPSIAPVDMDVKYPDTDASFDFKYPKRFFLAIKDKDNKEIRVVEVIVDVVNPVKIEMESVITPDAKEGASKYFAGITKWTNQGNHKINFQKATIYEDIDPAGGTTFKAITVYRELPGGGLEPGKSADVNVQVSAQYYLEGTYKSTAVFFTKIYQDNNSDDLFESAKVNITAKIVK
ncbi:hypothetical protein GCM10022396_03580 [Flavivirga amylovorans]